MEAKEFIAKRRQTVRLPDGSEFVIRKVSVTDVLRAGGNVDLAVFIEKAVNHPEKMNAGEIREVSESVLKRGIVSPKGVIDDLTVEECDFLFGAILTFSNFKEEVAKRLAPLSGTKTKSSSSTPSGDGTESPQASSPDSGDSKPTPSTPLAPGPDLSKSKRKPSA